MKADLCAMALFTALLGVTSGCGELDSHSHDGDERHPAAKVCGYEEGHGVFLHEETRRAIGLQTADVVTKAGWALLPESSLLSTAMGDFVYTVNGEHFQRTEVKLGDRADGLIAVAQGFAESTRVVTNGVRELWRIELQATKGGAACCH